MFIYQLLSLQVVNFTFAFGDLPTTLTVVNPKHFGRTPAMNYTAFLTVFSPSAWLMVALFMLTCCLGYIALEYSMAPNIVLTSMAYAFDILLKLGNSMSTSSVQGKFLFIIFSLHSLVIMAYYEGKLTSFMTAGEPRTQIRFDIHQKH